MPDRSQFPNCFSWYWSLAVFSQQTRVLWNPLHIDPALSDPESCDEEAPFAPPAQSREYQIDCEELDTLDESEETIQSERFLKMSRISARRSNSASSNMQACEELVHGLENGDDLPDSGDILIIKAKIVPEEGSSQIQICELVTNSLDLTNHDTSGQLGRAKSSHESADATQITRVISESHKSDSSRLDKMLQIGIAKNYSFIHEPEPPTEDGPETLTSQSRVNGEECESTKREPQKQVSENSKELPECGGIGPDKQIKDGSLVQKDFDEGRRKFNGFKPETSNRLSS